MTARPVAAGPRVLFLTDASAAIGMGHVSRCCALAAAMARLTRCTCFFPPGVYERAHEMLRDIATVRPSSDDDAYDIVIVDPPAPDWTGQGFARPAPVQVRITDTPSAEHVADIVVQPNLMSAGETSPGTALLAGSDYILLHPAYRACRPSPLLADIRRVLVCFGGSDPANLSRRLTHWLRQFDLRACWRLVLGPYYEGWTELLPTASHVPGLTVQPALPVLAHEMADCDLVILSGGTLLYEACALGRPAIVVSQNDLQAREAEVFAARGAVIHLGRHDLVTDSDLDRAVRQLWRDPEQRRRQALVAARTVPTDGADNVARRILARLASAGVADAE